MNENGLEFYMKNASVVTRKEYIISIVTIDIM